MTKYLFGLLATCFCLALSVDVGAVSPQSDQTEFVAQEAPIVFCESIEVDCAICPTFIEAIAPEHPSQPGESHGNQERSCGTFCEVINTNYPSLQIEAPPFERYRTRTDMSLDSVSAKEPDDNCLSDWKVGWQA
jgi:hypothetical protein